MNKKDLNKYYELINKYKLYKKNELKNFNSKDEEERFLKLIDEMKKNSGNIKEECFKHFLDMANTDEHKIMKAFNLSSRFGDVFVGEDNIYGKVKDLIAYFENELAHSSEYFNEDEKEGKEYFEEMMKDSIEVLKNTKENYVVMGIYQMDGEYHILDTEEELYELISLAKEGEDIINETMEKEEFQVVKRKDEEHYFRIDLKDNSSCYIAITDDIESIARQDVISEALNDNFISEGELDNIAEISAIAKTEFECMKNHNRNYPCTTYKDLLNRILGDCNVGVNSKEVADKIDENTKNLDQRENINSLEINNIKVYILGLGNEQFYVTRNSNEVFNKAQLLESIEEEKSKESEEEEEF